MGNPVFTRAQMQGGFVKSDEDYATWYVKHFMSEHFPEAVEITGEEELIRMCLTGILYAKHFRFCSRDEQGLFLTIMNSFGPDFWMFAGFKEIMENRQLTPDQKFEAIFTTIPKELKDNAAFNANPDYWYHHLIEDNPYIISNCDGART